MKPKQGTITILNVYYQYIAGIIIYTLKVLVPQSCPTLCNPMDCRSPCSSNHGDSPCKDIRVDCHAILQGIFPTQGSNPGLLNCRQILYRLGHREAQALLSMPYPH